jgi:hypothetical protein
MHLVLAQYAELKWCAGTGYSLVHALAVGLQEVQ